MSHFERRAGCAIYYRLYAGNRLVAVTVADKMLDGLAAIYSFFDPDQPRRSLGTGDWYKFARLAYVSTLRLFGVLDRGFGRWPISPDLLRLSSL